MGARTAWQINFVLGCQIMWVKAAQGPVRDYMQVDKQLVDLVDKEAFRRSVSDLGQR